MPSRKVMTIHLIFRLTIYIYIIYYNSICFITKVLNITILLINNSAIYTRVIQK